MTQKSATAPNGFNINQPKAKNGTKMKEMMKKKTRKKQTNLINSIALCVIYLFHDWITNEIYRP